MIEYTNVRRAHNGRGAKKSVEHSLRHGAASIIRSQARRVHLGEFDVTDLTHLQALHEVIEAATREAVAGLLEQGWTYGDVGDTLGMSRQGARQRFGAPASPTG